VDTQEKIDILFDNFKNFLKEKNKRYGDSAISPIKVFSKSDSGDNILNRCDEKLARIRNSPELRKNDICDLMGYLVLLCVQQNWTTFEDLID
jgi:hypothetical protein